MASPLTSIASRLRGRSPAEVWRLMALNARHALKAVRRDGRRARHAERAFDRRWGTDTSGGVGVHALDFAAERRPHCKRYDPSDPALLDRGLDLLGIDPAAYHFIDYGAGKGRPVLLAMARGFARVTGVELSARLSTIARANVARFAAGQDEMAAAAIVTTDAAAFIPDGDAILAYFYNPFDATIMASVRARLEAALAGATAAVAVIYVNPEHHAAFDAPGWTLGPSARGIATYRATAAAFRT